VLNVPDVRNTLAVSLLEAVGRWADHFHYDKGTVPRGGELVHSLGALDAAQDQVSYVKGSLPFVAVVIASQLLLIPRVLHQSGDAVLLDAVKVYLARLFCRSFFVVLEAQGTEGYIGWENRL
jgi:hypothetical protein